MTKKITCPNCEADLAGLSNFCSNCGSSLQIVSKSPPKITPMKFLSLVVASLAIFLFGWIAQSKLSGKKPEKMFTASAMGGESRSGETRSGDMHGGQTSAGEDQDYNDPELEKIRQHASDKPLDLDLQKTFAKLLIQKFRTFESPPQGLVFETIDVLRKILNLNPEDPDALIAMADISFDQQAFAKATEFYEKYLRIVKDDLNARARYASSLTFLGKHDQALAELGAVLKKDPKNFHAKAYTAITYAQMGKIEEARKFGKQAVELAPSPEAKERFTQFLKQLDAPKENSPRDNTKVDNKQGSGAADGPIVQYVKNNQIAGPKYRSHELTAKNELIINFENFPMQAMPPFAKDKFFNSLKEAAKAESVKPDKIVFRDLASPGKDLDVLLLK